MWRLPIQNHTKLPITDKRRNSHKTLSLRRRPGFQTLSKALDISSATARIAPVLLKALAILSHAYIRRSAVDQEDLRPYRKQSKKGDISLGDQKSYYLQVFKRFY